MPNEAHHASPRASTGEHTTATAPALLTVGELAASLRISRRHAAGLVASGKVASIKIGKCRRIPRSELARVLETGLLGEVGRAAQWTERLISNIDAAGPAA